MAKFDNGCFNGYFFFSGKGGANAIDEFELWWDILNLHGKLQIIYGLNI